MPKPWSLVDFVLVILGGFLGAALAVAASLVVDNEELVLVLVLVGQYLGHLLVLWLVARNRSRPDLGFEIEGRDVLYIGLGLGLQLALALVFYPLTSLLFPEGDSAQQVGSALSDLSTTAGRMAAVATAALLAPIVEELTFRGVLLKTLEGRSRRTVMVVTALVFCTFHLLGLQPDRFFQAAVVVLPQLFIVGLILARVTLRSGRLGPAIFIHSGFNLLAALVLLLPPELLESVS